jgi:hypothetical protein
MPKKSVGRGRSRNDAWIEAAAAADLLKCDVATIQELAEAGRLRWLLDGDVLMVKRDDVVELEASYGFTEMSDDEVRRNVVVLQRTVARLQSSVDLLLRVNGMAASSLGTLSDTELLSLFINMTDELRSTSWARPRLWSCAEVYVRIGDAEIDKLNELAKTEAAWRPFYELGLKQLRYVTELPELHTDLELQRIKDVLARGLTNLRSIAITFIELSGQTTSTHDLLARTAALDVAGFDTLVRQLKATSDRSHLEAQ